MSNSKSGKAVGKGVALAIGAAILFKVGSEIYNAFKSQPSPEQRETKEVEEEKKEPEDPAVFKLDADVDLDSLTCPITC